MCMKEAEWKCSRTEQRHELSLLRLARNDNACYYCICTGFVQAWAPQYGIHESRLVAFRFIVLYIVVFAVALVCYVTRKDDKLSMLSSKVFTAKSIGWMICQISLALLGLVLIFIFAWGKELSLPTQMLKYQSSETLFAEKFGYPYFYETAE